MSNKTEGVLDEKAQAAVDLVDDSLVWSNIDHVAFRFNWDLDFELLPGEPNTVQEGFEDAMNNAGEDDKEDDKENFQKHPD